MKSLKDCLGLKNKTARKRRRSLRAQRGAQMDIKNKGNTAEHDSSAEPESPLAGKSIEGLNIEKAIRNFGGDEISYVKVLHSYVTNTRAVIKSLDTFCDGNLNNYEIVIHGLKGSSASVCADELAAFAKSLEKAAKAKDKGFIQKHTHEFIAAAQEVIASLEALFSEIDSENPKPIKDKPDSSVLERLRVACDSYDMDGVDSAIDEITGYKYESGEELVFWLQENVEQMNFSEIVNKLSDV